MYPAPCFHLPAVELYILRIAASREVTTAEEDWKCRLHPPALPTDEITWICSECGDWMCKPSVELPKINMTLHEALQNPVLGISEPLCDDLVDAKNLVTELKFVDIDYSMFKNIKTEPLDELAGIERGYEQYLDQNFVSDEESPSNSEDSMSQDSRPYSLGSDDAGDFFLPLLNTLPKKFDPTTFKTLREFRPALKRHKDKDSNEGTPEKQFKPSSSEPQPSTSTATDESKNVKLATLRQLRGQVAKEMKFIQIKSGYQQLSEESSHKHTQGKNKNVSGHCSIPATKSTKNHYAEAYASDTKIIKVNSSNQGSTSKLPERNQYSALIGTEITAALSANATSAGKPNQRGGTSGFAMETQSQTPAIGQQLVRNTIPQSLISPQPISKTLQVHDTQPNTSKGPSTPQPVRNDKITDPQPSTSRKPLLLRVKTPVWLSTADVPQPRGTSSELIIAKSQAVLPQTSKASTAVTPSKQRANILQPKVITLAQHQPCLFQETSLLSTFPELQAEVPAASLVKTTAKEVSLPQPREHQGSSSKSVLRSKAVVSPIPVNVVTLPIPVVPPGSTPRVKTLSILQIVPPRTTNARAVPQPPSVSPHSTTRLTSPPVVQKMTVKRQILDMPQQIAYVTQQEVSHVVARDMTQQELTSAKPQEVSLTLKDMAQHDLQTTSQNIREPSPSNSQTLTEAGTRGMDRLIQAARNFDARQKEKHNITVQKQRIQAGDLQDTQLILQASPEMKCTLQEVGQGQPSSSTQAASLQKDIPIASPMKTHQILTEIYPWRLEGSRLSTPSPEFAQLVQQITTEVHNPSTLQEDSPVQQIETSPPQLPLEDLMDQLSSLQETDPTSPYINPPRSLPEELFQI
ncbi:unnamed protein product [Acanthoscelides obtectus]|uniref:Uncharacterized protein n=1 Tax=Acanthoscelides obtectus TaxID=200917 RepID=A0A9P0VS59_ACAOB|nr:unnamed protein product [Acanthoscelides obtectus]CAK1683579.1 hypothetical protein AOBTE_LOCUS34334 [Acanthoscelides obtectus]